MGASRIQSRFEGLLIFSYYIPGGKLLVLKFTSVVNFRLHVGLAAVTSINVHVC